MKCSAVADVIAAVMKPRAAGYRRKQWKKGSALIIEDVRLFCPGGVWPCGGDEVCRPERYVECSKGRPALYASLTGIGGFASLQAGRDCGGSLCAGHGRRPFPIRICGSAEA